MKVNQFPTATSPNIEKTKGPNGTEAARARTGQESAAASDLDSAKGANVSISDDARLLQKAMEVARNAPDLRADKVAALKKSVANGTYKIDAAAVADKLVDEHLRTDFGKNSL